MLIAVTALHHRHEKKGRFVGADDTKILHHSRTRSENKDSENHSCIVHGQMYCHGSPIEGVRPYLMSPQYPKFIINICATNENGWYRLSTGAFFELTEKVYLTVRHQCEIDDFPPMPKCAVPYYTSQIPIDVTNTTYVGRNFELSELKAYSSADCLY
uniref:Uncharacterized protein n=1 Tax=Caenorhabditis japonica TaxID=281687 RepID=A0A8R1DKG4_CAEJA